MSKKMPIITCTHCKQQHKITPSAFVPEYQHLTMSLKSESEMFDAQGLGDLLTATAKSMRAVAKGMGTSVAVFVSSVTVTHGSIDVGFVIAEKRKKGDAATPTPTTEET